MTKEATGLHPDLLDIPSVNDSQYEFPIHTAAKLGSLSVLLHILQFCPEVTLRDHKGHTAAHVAANVECLKLLHQYGADISPSNLDSDSKSVFHCCCETNKLNSIAFLLSLDYSDLIPQDLWFHMCKHGYFDVIQLLERFLSLKILDSRDKQGLSCSNIAHNGGLTDLFNYLNKRYKILHDRKSLSTRMRINILPAIALSRPMTAPLQMDAGVPISRPKTADHLKQEFDTNLEQLKNDISSKREQMKSKIRQRVHRKMSQVQAPPTSVLDRQVVASARSLPKLQVSEEAKPEVVEKWDKVVFELGFGKADLSIKAKKAYRFCLMFCSPKLRTRFSIADTNVLWCLFFVRLCEMKSYYCCGKEMLSGEVFPGVSVDGIDFGEFLSRFCAYLSVKLKVMEFETLSDEKKGEIRKFVLNMVEQDLVGFSKSRKKCNLLSDNAKRMQKENMLIIRTIFCSFSLNNKTIVIPDLLNIVSQLEIASKHAMWMLFLDVKLKEIEKKGVYHKLEIDQHLCSKLVFLCLDHENIAERLSTVNQLITEKKILFTKTKLFKIS